MGYLFGWLIGYLLYGCILGFITRYVSESKGYSGGFAWGFFLGIIGLLVVGFRPNIQTDQSSYMPMYGGALQATRTSNRTWTCVCGAKNREGLNYCPICRRTREESNTRSDIKCPHCGTVNNANRKVCLLCNQPLDGTATSDTPVATDPTNCINETAASLSPVEISGIEMLEGLARLHEQGILTDEEFSQKKADILSRM